MSLTSAWMLLAACASTGDGGERPPDTQGSGGTGALEDTAWMTYPTTEAEPEWDVAAFEAQVLALTALGAFNTHDIGAAFKAVMSHGDGFCPDDIPNTINALLGCTSRDGTVFSGVAWYTEFSWDESSHAPTSYLHGGDFIISGTDGTTFAGGGEIEVSSEGKQGDRIAQVDFKGSWVSDDDEGWLGQGVSGVLLAEVVDTLDEHSVSLDGGISLGGIEADFQEVVADDGGSCDSGLRGTLGLRDDAGHWTEWRLGDDCDTCGDVVFADTQVLGELCLDLSEWASLTYTSWLPHH